MDLIFSNTSHVDIGVLMAYDLDVDLGDSNDFALTITGASQLGSGYLIYVEGAEYGGIIDAVKVETKKNKATYSGRTWRGLLESKIIVPTSGQAYKTVSGEANTVIGSMLSYCGLTDLFEGSSEASGINIPTYSFNRYTDLYAGLTKMLSKLNGKLKLAWDKANGKVKVEAVLAEDYSEQHEITSDQMDLIINRSEKFPNHIIGLGGGELASREVIHRYIDADGEISETQYYTGADEWTIVYDYANAESTQELIEGATSELMAQKATSTIKINVANIELDIGDTVSAVDITTGTTVTAKVTNKIVKISNGFEKISYKVE